jgi:hypothetical protein
MMKATRVAFQMSQPKADPMSHAPVAKLNYTRSTAADINPKVDPLFPLEVDPLSRSTCLASLHLRDQNGFSVANPSKWRPSCSLTRS